VDSGPLAEAPELESRRAGLAAQLTRLGELRTRLLSLDAAHDTGYLQTRPHATSPALPRLPSEETPTRKD